jgi:hypothetical protein
MDPIGWIELKEARKRYQDVEERYKLARCEVQKARNEVDSMYEAYSEASRSFLRKPSNASVKTPIQRQLLHLQAKRYVLEQEVKHYKEAKDNYLTQKSAILSKWSEIDDLLAKISHTKSMALKKFNGLATSLIKATLGERLKEVRIDEEFEITVREAQRPRRTRSGGSTFRKPNFHDEKAVLAVISAAVLRKLYQPTFPFIAFDDLLLGPDLSDRLARALCVHVDYVIYTEHKASVRHIDIVSRSCH